MVLLASQERSDNSQVEPTSESASPVVRTHAMTDQLSSQLSLEIGIDGPKRRRYTGFSPKWLIHAGLALLLSK